MSAPVYHHMSIILYWSLLHTEVGTYFDKGIELSLCSRTLGVLHFNFYFVCFVFPM